MEIWVLTTESDDFDSEIVALSGSMAEAMLAAETYAGAPLEWEDESDISRAIVGSVPVHRTCYSPKVGRLSLRGPFPFPFALPPYVTWEERQPLRCPSVHGDFNCAESDGHAGKHRSAPASGGYFSRPQMEWE